jgi:hypothetical protein
MVITWFQCEKATGYLRGYCEDELGNPPPKDFVEEGVSYTWKTFYEDNSSDACIELHNAQTRYIADALAVKEYIEAIQQGSTPPVNPSLNPPYDSQIMDSISFDKLEREIEYLIMRFKPYIPCEKLNICGVDKG